MDVKQVHLQNMQDIIINIDFDNRIVISKDTETNIISVRHMAYGYGDAGDEWKEINQMNIDCETV